jgi:hypothetical protein
VVEQGFLDYPDPDLIDRCVRLRRWALTDLECIELASHDRRIPANEPSLRALRRVGFITEGVLRRQYYSGGMHHDMVGLSLIADDLDRA